MGYWIPFPAFGLDRRFDRCERCFRERRSIVLFVIFIFVFIYSSARVHVRSRASLRIAIPFLFPLLRILVCGTLTTTPWLRFAKYSLPDIESFDLDLATLWITLSGRKRVQMRARTLYTNAWEFHHGTELLPETNERKYFRFAQDSNNFFFF